MNKLRFWDWGTRQMVYLTIDDILKRNDKVLECTEDPTKRCSYPIEWDQISGLMMDSTYKDIHGKKIYEGDIIPYNGINRLVWVCPRGYDSW